MTPIAALEHVRKSVGRHSILRDITFGLHPASLVLLCGPNGAGKSTIFRLIAGLSRPTSGKISIAPHTRTAYLGHATFIYPGLTALENLEFQAKTRRTNYARGHLLEILEKMGLRQHADDFARIFSRGMAQRLNFARILAGEADLLLLDEPFTGLDRKSSAIIRAEILKKRDEGCAIALVSHDLENDLCMADKAVAIDKGKVSWDGDARDYEKIWRQGQ